MSKKTIQLLFLTIVSGLLFFCKTKKVNNKKQVVFEKNNTIDTIYNQDKSKILILNYTIEKNPITIFNYQVIDTKTKKELKKDVFIGEKMEWLNNTTLKCIPHIGIIRKESDEVFEKQTIKKNRYITIKID